VNRKALTRLLLSSHTLSIEILRYKKRLKERVPRDSRLCRFCRRAVESESHALLGCTAPALVAIRYDFLADVYSLVPETPHTWPSYDVALRDLVQTRDFDLIQRLAKYTDDVFAVYSTCPIFRPAEYLYHALESYYVPSCPILEAGPPSGSGCISLIQRVFDFLVPNVVGDADRVLRC
jgi:hypothetical protein